MKNLIFILLALCFVSVKAQENRDLNQNPNSQIAYQKYAKLADSYTKQQGTTLQQTYVAIDPLEEKRVREKIHKDHRAMRSLWRHEERIERAKNTKYYSVRTPYRSSYYGGIGYQFPFYRNRFYGSGLGLGIQFPLNGWRF